MVNAGAIHVQGLHGLVTGAGSGIGQATSVALAAAGASRLILAGRRAETLAETAAKIAAVAPACKAVAVPGDVAAEGDRTKLAAAVQGRLDCLVNCAGLFVGSPLRATRDEIWRQQMDVNVTAPFALTRALVEPLARSANASVINISSTLAAKPIPATAAYNASKAALIQLSRTLALELGPEKIRVNCILPAIVETPMYGGRFDDEAAYKAGLLAAAKLHPLGRVGQPEDVAQAVVFLASNAASWITGVALPVDGGMLCT